MSHLLLLAGLACRKEEGPPGTGSTPTDDFCADHSGEAVCDGQTAVRCSEKGKVDDFEACPAGCADGACLPCGVTLAALHAAEGAAVTVEVDAAGGAAGERLPRLRPFEVDGGRVVSWTGPFVAFLEDGTEVPSGGSLPEALPLGGRLLVGATEPGSGELTVQSACEESASLPLQARLPAPVAVHALDDFPFFERADLFTERDTVGAFVDPAVYPDRVGLQADLYVVPDRDRAQWAREPGLQDAVVGPVPLQLADGPLAEVTDLWSDLPSGAPFEAFDVVVDFGGDGQLDPGDLLDGLDEPAFVLGGDLAAPGPYTPVSAELSSSFWVTMRVYWPEELDALDPVPLVVISHGNGHEYTWYDYLGEHLASHGYAVISHRNNTAPGTLTAAETTLQNTDAFLGGLGSLQGGALDGEIDPHNIAWIGHSRGGEGVVIAYHWVVTGQEVPANFVAGDVRLVSSIAPTVFEDPRDSVNPHGVTYHLLAGSLDGDVTGGTSNPVVQYFRIFQNATGLSAATYLQGADHNDFNCCGFNDALLAGSHGAEIGRARAQQAAKSYYLALLEAALKGRAEAWELFARAPERLRPDDTDVIIASQLVRGDGDRKFVIDDFQSNPAPDRSSSGGQVTATVRALQEGVLQDGDGQLTWRDSDPMNGMTQSSEDTNPERGIVFQWDPGDTVQLEFEIPAERRDFREQAFLSFRAAQGSRHPNTLELDGMLSFSVALVDGQGNTSALDHQVYGRIPKPYPRAGEGQGSGWSNEFQTLRLPIEAFAQGGRPLDLENIVAVRFLFGEGHGSAVGRLGLDDLELLERGAP